MLANVRCKMGEMRKSMEQHIHSSFTHLAQQSENIFALLKKIDGALGQENKCFTPNSSPTRPSSPVKFKASDDETSALGGPPDTPSASSNKDSQTAGPLTACDDFAEQLTRISQSIQRCAMLSSDSSRRLKEQAVALVDHAQKLAVNT